MPSPSSSLCPHSPSLATVSPSGAALLKCLTGSCFRGILLTRLPLLTLPFHSPHPHPRVRQAILLCKCAHLSPGIRAWLHLEDCDTQSNKQLGQVEFNLLHSSCDCCEVRQRCGQKPGQQALSVLLQIWRRVNTSVVVSRTAAYYLRGAG